MPDAFAHCAALVRAADKDRYVATLYAPVERRGALHALYAFDLETARVREAVRQPLAGEIRLQWWSDVIAGKAEAAGSPVAAALIETAARHALPAERIEAMIEARRRDLYDEPSATLAELEDWADRAVGGPIALAARVLAEEGAVGIDALARHAGIALGLTALLTAFPREAARGRQPLPLDVLARHGLDRAAIATRPAAPALLTALSELRAAARGHLVAARPLLAAAPLAAMPALLPAAIVAPTLARQERRDPFAPVELAQWRRQLLIARAARRPARLFE
jgi:phytoene synthase